MMRRLLYHLGLIDLVWTVDSSGETRLRTVWWLRGEPVAFGICFPPLEWNVVQYGVKLNANGTCSPLMPFRTTYVKSWVAYGARVKPVRNWISPWRVR